jgi:glycosyltransferase involved in cell wall biosynthesis
VTADGAARVLFLHSSAGRYGADRQLHLLATGLDRERFEPICVLAEDGPLRGDLEEAGVEVHVRPLAVLRRSLMSPAGMARVAAAFAADAGGLGRLARTRGVRIVHTNTSVTLGGAAAARIAGARHVWHVREIYAGFERWWPAYRRLLLTADALPCVSAATAAQFDTGPVHVLHDGLAAQHAPRPRDEARAALDLPAQARVVAVLGRLSPWKGQDVLIRAIAELDDAIALMCGAPWRGEERLERELRELARTLGVADRVRFLGFRDDLDVILGAVDAVAVPSTQPDPLPNAALEAAAAGRCVIAAAHGGLTEIVRHGETGLLVEPGDPAALAAAIAGADPRLGEAAARDVAERFAPQRLLAGVEALYDDLLARA